MMYNNTITPKSSIIIINNYIMNSPKANFSNTLNLYKYILFNFCSYKKYYDNTLILKNQLTCL